NNTEHNYNARNYDAPEHDNNSKHHNDAGQHDDPAAHWDQTSSVKGETKECMKRLQNAAAFLFVGQRSFSGEVATHAVDSSNRRSGRGTEIEAFHRRSVQAGRGTQEELCEHRGPTTDVATDQIRIALLQICGREHRLSGDAIAKAGSKALDL